MMRKITFSLIAIAMMVLLISCASEIEAPTAPNAPDRGTLVPAVDPYFSTLLVEPVNTDSLYFVYLPAGYDANRTEGYPVVYMLHGFGGNEYYFSVLFDATKVLDKLIEDGDVDPMILVFPSSNNAFGGNFYTDSGHPAVMQGGTHILDIVDAVDAAYNTIDDPAGRGVCGASMGGYGAIRMAEAHGDVFGSASMHSAPLTFDGGGTEYPGVLSLLPTLLEETGYDAVLESTAGAGDAAQFQALMVPTAGTISAFMFAASAAWSPTNPLAPTTSTIAAYGVDLPIGIDGQLHTATWNRWLAFDPMAAANVGNFAVTPVQLYFDSGLNDDLGFNYAHDVFMGALQTFGLGALVHVGVESGTYSPMESNFGMIAADHVTQTFSRLEGMLKFHGDQF